MTIRVLLADDHAILRDGVRLLLEMEPDIEIVGDAANGRDAVQMALSQSPDVVILDILMPELNGIEAARQIHQEQLQRAELFNGRAAMLGLVIGVVVEGLTGFSVVHQIGLGPLVDGYAACHTNLLPFCL